QQRGGQFILRFGGVHPVGQAAVEQVHLRVFAKGVAVDVLAHVDVVIDVVFAHAGDGEGGRFAVGVFHGDDVAHIQVLAFGQLFGDDHRALFKGHRFAGGALAEGEVVV